jgi:signal transduction histidine kinase
VTLRLRIALWFGLSMCGLILLITLFTEGSLRERLKEVSKFNTGDPNNPGYHLHVGYSQSEIDEILRKLLEVRLLVALPVILLSVGVGYALATRSMRSIDGINRELSKLGPEDLARGISAPEKDRELSQLVEHINGLLRRIASSYAEVSEFSGRVAHELRTPLSLLRMRVEAEASRLPSNFSEDLQEEIARLTRLVERSLTIAKAQGGKLEPDMASVDLTAMLADLQEGYEMLGSERNLAMKWEVPKGLVVRADADFLRQILHNLLGNAVRYAGHSVTVQAARIDGGKRVKLEISNDLPSSSAAFAGTGIGLRLVKALASAIPGFACSAGEQDGRYIATVTAESSQTKAELARFEKSALA